MINFQVRAWKLATFCDKCAGYWPYDSWVKKGSILSYHLLVFISTVISLAYNWKKNIGFDSTITFKCALAILFILGDLSKLVGNSVFQDQRRRIYGNIFGHFNEIVDKEEIKILRYFSNQGLRYFIIYMSSAMTLAGIWTTIPLLRTVGDGQLCVQLPFELDYGVDVNEHLLPIFLHFSSFFVSAAIMNIAFDLSFILQVHHICAITKIARTRLIKITKIFSEYSELKSEVEKMAEAYSLMKTAIELQGESYELISMVDNALNLPFFFLLLINSAIFGAEIHLVSITSEDFIESLRHVLVFVMILLHFFAMFSQGQKVIDYTSDIFEACYECEWYRLPKKIRSLWLIIMICSSRPRSITGGKCFVLSFETYSKMLKAGISYYTVFEN